jgi:hypothetical protein
VARGQRLDRASPATRLGGHDPGGGAEVPTVDGHAGTRSALKSARERRGRRGAGLARRRGSRTASEATPISQGTSAGEGGTRGWPGGARPPAAPPAIAKGTRRRTVRPCPLSSGRNPQTDPSAAEHERDRVGDIGAHGRKPGGQQRRVADQGRQPGHAAAQAAAEPGQTAAKMGQGAAMSVRPCAGDPRRSDGTGSVAAAVGGARRAVGSPFDRP